jgi:hypothetical protein
VISAQKRPIIFKAEKVIGLSQSPFSTVEFSLSRQTSPAKPIYGTSERSFISSKRNSANMKGLIFN